MPQNWNKLILQFVFCIVQYAWTTSPLSLKSIYMSTTATIEKPPMQNQAEPFNYKKEMLLYQDLKKNSNNAVSSNEEIGKFLTTSNRKYSDLGLNLRSAYKNLRLLTENEESVAGKCSSVGKRLEKIRKKLTKHLERQPTNLEWAEASKLTTYQLELYLNIANRARNRLVQHNIRMVDYCVRKIIEYSHAANDISYYELVVEGFINKNLNNFFNLI
jgi:hypothetical protein